METPEDSIANNPLPKAHDPLPLARLHHRTLAFIMDAILCGFFLTTVLITFIIPNYYSAEWNKLTTTIQAYQKNQNADTSLQDYVLQSSDTASAFQTVGIAFLIVYLLGFWLYFVASEIFTQGASLGKKMFSIQVISMKTLREPSPFESIYRSSIKTICFLSFFQSNLLLSLPFLINFLVVFIMKNRKAGHDYLAGTLVVEAPNS